jgi:hypothetical protein
MSGLPAKSEDTMKSIIIATVIMPFVSGIYNGWTSVQQEMVYEANEARYEQWVQRVEFASGLKDAINLPEDCLVTIPAPNH